MQHPRSISQTEAADMETDGVDSDDDNDVLKSDQVRLAITETRTVFCDLFIIICVASWPQWTAQVAKNQMAICC